MSKEEMTLKCTEKFIAGAEGVEGYEWVRLYEFRFPWNDYHFKNTRFFHLKRCNMDEWDEYDLFFNDLRSAMAALGREANRCHVYGNGTKERMYNRVEYCEDWRYYMEELLPDRDDGHYHSSATNGDYGPSNPWNAPGMSVSDFLPGVY